MLIQILYYKHICGISYEAGKDLTIKQLDEYIAQYAVLAAPGSSWINTIRNALGMSARSLGTRIAFSQPRIALMEKAAQGLGCRDCLRARRGYLANNGKKTRQ